jgi:2-dehydro-3-deoxyphosphogluconate aldolase/(4S)-4-hydroxy-2-oxoglutarate aldolase
VDLKNAADWIKAGAACLGVGSSLVTKDALAKNDWGSIAANAKAFVQAVAGARGKA